jgi:3-oxoacyl-[acyl-carrier-protein] synthase III
VRVNDVFISSVGVHLPEWVSSEQAIADGMYEEEVYKASGLTGTHVAGDQTAVGMAVSAARSAIERAEVDADTIDSHIHSSVYYQGPDGSYPPGYILRELGAGNIPALDIHQGCNGMLAALDTAVGQITGAAKAETVLLTTAQNFSTPTINRWKDFGSTYILSDGAAAAVVSADSGFAEIRSLNTGTLHMLEKWHRGEESLLPPQTKAHEELSVGERAIQFNENDMPLTEILESLSKFDLDILFRSLVDADVNAADIAKVIAINLDGRMIDQALMQPLGLPMERSTWEFGKSVGHAGAADLIISLDHSVRSGELSPGDHVLLTSQGPGWICSSAVLKIVDVPAWAN